MKEFGKRYRKRASFRIEPPVKSRLRLLEQEEAASVIADDAHHDGVFKEAAMQAWFATALESTKSIFTLASAGVGLSATLAFGSDIGSPQTSWAPVWLVFAAFFFGCSSLSCIRVFRLNAVYVKRLANPSASESEDEAETKDEQSRSRVRRFDLASKLSFVGGLIFLLFALIAKTWLT